MNRKLDNKRKTNAMNGNRPDKPATGLDESRQMSSDSLQSGLIGVNNLRPKCEQTFRLIVSNVSSDSSLICEKQLWNDIKQYRHQKDSILIEYLIGFYVSLVESIAMNGHNKEPFSLFANSSQLSPTTKLLLYNILIRIGDLNRYLSKTSIAETYYLSARKLDVMRGHAYNQLAINTPLTSQHLKCIYYYCRAAKSCVEPIPIAETNLKVAVDRIDSDILKTIIRSSQNLIEDLEPEDQLILTYPQKGIDWFYLSVISSYSQNFETIFKPLIQYLVTNCELTSNRYLDNNSNNDLSFALMAFDVSLDWIGLSNAKKTYFDEHQKELRDLKIALKTCSETINEVENRGNDCENQRPNETIETKPLFHDYILRGFSPLTQIHNKLVFDSNETLVVQSNRLLIRVIDKLDKLFGKSMKPKRMRNVALGSILEIDTN